METCTFSLFFEFSAEAAWLLKNAREIKLFIFQSTLSYFFIIFLGEFEFLFFTSFVPEAPRHILLYVVGRCKKGVVKLTYEWCLFYVAKRCTCGGQSARVPFWPVLLSAHWACSRACALQIEFSELAYGLSLRGAHEGPIKMRPGRWS